MTRVILLQGGVLDKIDEDMANGLCQAAAELAENQEIDSAKKACLLALEIIPEHAPSHTLLGAIALSQGEENEAIRELEIASLSPVVASKKKPMAEVKQATNKRTPTAASESDEKPSLFGHLSLALWGWRGSDKGMEC